MSYAAERWARSQIAGNARAKSVLIELAHCLNGRTGQCTPSVAYLSRITELKADTVTKATNELQDRGLITKTIIKTKSGRACSYSLVGFVPSDWTDENGDKPLNGDTARNVDTPETGVTHTPENGVTDTPETGVTHTPENGDRTGNKNREVEQGSRTGNKKSKGSRLTITDLPDDWKEFCEKEDNDLDPVLVFFNFRDYWTSVSGAKAIKLDWTATWRNCVRSYRGAPDWKRRPVLKKTIADEQRIANLGKKINGQTQLLTVQERKDSNDWGLW